MTLPTEAELIEMENRLSKILTRSQMLCRRADPYADCDGQFDRVREDFQLLISLARDPSQLLRHIPDDDERWRAYRAIDQAIHPLRTSNPAPAPSVRPKRKKQDPRRFLTGY